MEEKALDLSTKQFLFPAMHPEGRPFVLVCLALAVLVAVGVYALCCVKYPGRYSWAVLVASVTPFLVLAYGVSLFFRNPERVPPADPSAILSPADGIVSLITRVPLPEELNEPDRREVWRISVFMSVLNVHVNRMPYSGKILKKCYVPGKFFNASLDKASKDNERMLYLVGLKEGRKLGVVQIAGLIARRIVSFVGEGQTLNRAERFGLIRFGSRLDIYLPAGVEPAVRLGQIMIAGESVLARMERVSQEETK